MRSLATLFLLVCMAGCSTSPIVGRSSVGTGASLFVGRWSPAGATSQPYLASTMGFQLALDENGAAMTRGVLVRKPTTEPATQPATVVREVRERGTWMQTSPTIAELCLDGSSDRATARLRSENTIVLSAPDAPDIELQRER